MVDSEVVVVTGTGSGLCAHVAREIRGRSQASLTIEDLDPAAVAAEVGGVAVESEVSTESGGQSVVNAVMASYGRVDVWIANAGNGLPGDPFSGDEVFDLMWRLHALSLVWAARPSSPTGWSGAAATR